MNEIIVATWLVLLLSGLLLPYFVASTTHQRAHNFSAGFTSVILLLSSMIIAPFVLSAIQLGFFMVFGLYSVGNVGILAFWQFHPTRTIQQFLRNQRQLFVILLILGGVLTQSATVVLLVLQISGLVIASLLLLKLLRIYVSREWREAGEPLTRKQLPTLTFAVPARNETHALTKHLQSAVKTDYPKVEFLVLDDCSQDDTSQIIRAFAHDGVRFIKGHEPDGSWLGKNHAYSALSEAASGQFVVFSGVDTRYEPESLRKLVQFIDQNKLDMVSVLPGHVATSYTESLIQPMRYLSMFARSSEGNPPVLSTLWVIRKEFLTSNGNLKAVKSSIKPESYFANKAAKDGRYRFFAFGGRIGITSRKTTRSQADTALRQLYPMLGRSLSKHLLYLLAMLATLVVPMIAMFMSDGFVLPSLVTLLFMYASYLLTVSMSHANMLMAYTPVNFLVGIFLYLYLSIASAVRYETNQISWKDRNVCEPVLDSTQIRAT